MALLELKNLHVALEDGTEIVKGVDLAVDTDQIHAVMGPNGNGSHARTHSWATPPTRSPRARSSLTATTSPSSAPTSARSAASSLAFQYPHAIPGVTVTSFMRSAINAIRKARVGEDDPIPIPEFRKEMMAAMERLRIPRSSRSAT